MLKVISMAGGLAGAVSLSQFPEFSQQYMQRMAGAVDELHLMVTAFDLTARVNGMTRDEALERLAGDEFRDGVRDNIAQTVERYERLSQNLYVLRNMGTVKRLTQMHRFTDTELAQRTWDDFKPAVPVTTEGFLTAGIGFLVGWLGIGLLFAALMRVTRRVLPI